MFPHPLASAHSKWKKKIVLRVLHNFLTKGSKSKPEEDKKKSYVIDKRDRERERRPITHSIILKSASSRLVLIISHATTIVNKTRLKQSRKSNVYLLCTVCVLYDMKPCQKQKKNTCNCRLTAAVQWQHDLHFQLEFSMYKNQHLVCVRAAQRNICCQPFVYHKDGKAKF